MVHVALAIPVFMSMEKDKKTGLFIGVFYFIIYLLSSRASRLSALFTNKYKRRIADLTLFIGFGSGILSGIFYFKELWIPSLITFASIYIAENIRKPALTGFVADNTPNEILTSVISAQSLLKTILTAILALLFGMIAQSSNIGTAMFVVSFILFISVLILNFLTAKKQG
jgi:hypothetical protein